MVGLGRVWVAEAIAEAVGGELQKGAQGLQLRAVAWDTRRMHGGGALFLALRGQRDGHTYLPEAFRRGAQVALSERLTPFPHILVPDTWQALHAWALAWRQQLTYPLVGIAGSVGKTWTKEWLAYLLEGHRKVVRSPGSFNSQLGVPLSLLSFPAEAEVGIVEAGSSTAAEMARLQALLQPTYGILTPTYAAEAEASLYPAVLQEKLSLFLGSIWLVGPDTVPLDLLQAYLPGVAFYRVGAAEGSEFRWEAAREGKGWWHPPDAPPLWVELPSSNPALQQNALLAASAAYLLGVPASVLRQRLATLPALPRRLQWIQDSSGRLWLNDTYHADPTSIAVALEELRSLPIQPKVVVLTDFSPPSVEAHATLLQRLAEEFTEDQVHLIGPIFAQLDWGRRYGSVEEFLRQVVLPSQGAILLKGSRRFALEQAFTRLSGYGPAPELYVDLERVARNLARLRQPLPPSTRLMAVLKAEAYGGGDLLMASFLARQGIDYIGVAYAPEAVRLRQAGIQTPILVFYPGEAPYALYQEYSLEAAVGSWPLLRYWAGAVPLHIEFDTGMGRMGFLPEELEAVLAYLKAHRAVVRGVFTHLAAAHQPELKATRQQLEVFEGIYRAFRKAFPEVLGHALNTAGILHIGAAAAYDMVRLGIGLYGIGEGLEEATALYAPLLRLQSYPSGRWLNYDFQSSLPEGYRVATIGIGYGDGLPRRWAAEGGTVFVRGVPCPILPPLNMDLLLAAVPDKIAEVGDRVEIWGPTQPLRQLAQALGTIPYELLVHLGRRVRRIYTWGERPYG